jgi:hypothetical protein
VCGPGDGLTVGQFATRTAAKVAGRGAGSEAGEGKEGEMTNDATALETLRRQAERFRRAIGLCDRSLLPVTFQSFPRGSCGDANLLLGTYLTKHGLGDFEYVIGERGSKADSTWASHAWIRQGNTIIDITADQFPEMIEPIVVSNDSSWHDTFTQNVEHAADYRVYDGYTRSVLDNAYRSIVAKIEE